MFLGDTSRFKVHQIIYNDGEFAIASGYWDGASALRLVCRWHAEGIGYPQTYGKPQWMAFPDTATIEVTNVLDLPGSAVALRLPATTAIAEAPPT